MAESFADSMDRMRRAGLIISITATVAVLIFGGWRNALGFACGAVIAHFNFGLWKQIAGALGPQEALSNPGTALLVSRYLLIGGLAFVIMKVLNVSALPVIGGLLVTAAAVMVEIVRQLVNAAGKPK